MALPKEPRQKMINVMYLVLTALLALNVSSEILNAFKTVNTSLVNANATIERKNNDIFKSFAAKMNDPQSRDRAAIWMPKAQQAKKLADDLHQYIEGLKLQLKKESGLEMKNGVEVFKEDDLDASSRFLVEGPGQKKGEEFRSRMEAYKNGLLAIDPEIKAQFASTLPLDLSIPVSSNNQPGKSWERSYFYMTPTIAAITIMSKFENDVRNSEAMVVDFCHSKVGQVEVVYDAFQAFAGTNATYLLPGEELQITAGVGSFSTKALPAVSIDGANVSLNSEGVAEWKTTVGGSGPQTKKVRVTFKKPDGSTATVEKEVKYTVGVAAGMTISTDATRVFYQGLDNPVSVVGGGGAERTQVSIEGAGGSISSVGPGQYVAKFTKLGTAVINATDGRTKASASIKVKRVPDPEIQMGGNPSGALSASLFKGLRGINAVLKDFVFEGVKYQVSGFTIVFNGKNFSEQQYATCSGPAFNGEAQRHIARSVPGTLVTITNVDLIEPGGGKRPLNGAYSFSLD